MTKARLIKGTFHWGWLTGQSSVYMPLESDVRILQAAGRKRQWAWLEHLKPPSPPAVAHTSSKATPLNSALSYEPTGTIFIQTTTRSFK